MGGGFPITLFAKFAAQVAEDSVKESSTILTVSNALSSQEITLQVKKILAIIEFLIWSSEQLLFTGCNLLWRKLLASRLPSSQFKLLRFVFPAYPRQPFLELFNGGNGGKGCLSKHLKGHLKGTCPVRM